MDVNAKGGRGALFLDRDGIVNEDVGYAHRPDQIRFLPGIFAVVAAANACGMPVIIVTNQAGIARGYYGYEEFKTLMDWMQEQFRTRGAHIDTVYFCPHHPVHGKGALKRACTCRKPAPGMLLRAAQEHRIDLTASIMVGDSAHDMEAAEAAGVGKLLILASGKKKIEICKQLPQQTRSIEALHEIFEYLPS